MEVDKQKCIACCGCVSICPVEAISLKDGKAFIDKKKCIHCGSCASVCPVEAISEE